MRIRQGASGVMALAVIGLAAAGCTGPGTSTASPSATGSTTVGASASPTISPSPTTPGVVEPTPTPEMAQPSADGAAATARYFIELYM
ncbi:MAG: hypothetical protein J7523_15885, partial [Cellulomonas sp.]|nr:hypothetical protein [Cellulomonas sp.]